MGQTLEMLMRNLVRWLETPTVLALLLATGWALWELGATLGERTGGLKLLEQRASYELAHAKARVRIERADLLARVGPMLGLMGTLIPLGPGLAALGRGEVSELARAVTVAFDTTVLGLLIGMTGFVIGRLRRRWYDGLLDRVEARAVEARAVEAQHA